MFRFYILFYIFCFWHHVPVKSNLIQDEFTKYKNKIPMIDVLIFHIY